jgi:DnaJ-class molecular chaperone
MDYDPSCDYYALLGLSAEASATEITQAIDRERDLGRARPAIDDAARVLLDRSARTLYDVKRARYRVRQLVLFDELGAWIS